MARPKEETELPTRQVESAMLHSAIMIGGKTEATLTSARLPGVKLNWLTNEGLSVEFKGKTCLIPSAGIKQVNFK